MKGRCPIAWGLVLLAGCGGSETAPPAEPTAVAGVQAVAPGAESTSPATSPSTSPATSPPAPPPAAASPSTPLAAPAVPAEETVGRDALIAALLDTRRWRIVGELRDTRMTELSADATATVMSRTVNLRPLAEPEALHETTLRLDVASGPGALSFVGTGTVTVRGPAPGVSESVPVQGPQVSVGESTRLPSTVARWTVPGDTHAVRLELEPVGTPSGRFRACWSIDVPGASRRTCGEHLKADGRAVGATATHALEGGQIVAHASEEDVAAPLRVLDCVATWRPSGAPSQQRRSAYSDVFRFASPDLLRGGWPNPQTIVGPTDDPLDRAEAVTLPDGAVRYLFEPHPITWASRFELVVRDGAPEAFDYASNLESTRESCR